MALVIGILMGFGLNISIEYFDNTIRSVEYIERKRLPVLAIIPSIGEKLAQKITEILAKYTKQAINELNELNESNADKNNNFNCPVMVEIVDLTDSYKREDLG